MKNVSLKFGPVINSVRVGFVGGNGWFFVPGAFFLLLGLFALVAPKFLLGLLVALFVFLGALFCFVGWKVVRLKNRLQEFVKKGGAQVLIQKVESPTTQILFEDEIEPEKKITYH